MVLGNVSFTTTSDVLTLDAWNHVALTFDNATDTINLYVDGVLKDTQVAAGGIAPRTSRGVTYIGRSKNDFFTGKIDEVRIWNSVRSVQNIMDYKNTDLLSPLTQNDLIAYYKFDEGEGGDGTTLLSMAPVNISGTLSIGSGDAVDKWANNVITPVTGLLFQQVGVELTWSVEDETGVKAYQLVNVETGELIDSVIASEKNYRYTLEEDVQVKLIVVDNSGFSQTFYPENGNVVVTTYDLSIGWNLIAIVGENAETEALGSELWGWNGVAYELVQHSKSGQAVWIYSKIEKQVTVEADKSESKLNLEQGWNMVGVEENMAVPAGALVIYSWNELYQNIAKDGLLLQGVGYWIFSL